MWFEADASEPSGRRRTPRADCRRRPTYSKKMASRDQRWGWSLYCDTSRPGTLLLFWFSGARGCYQSPVHKSSVLDHHGGSRCRDRDHRQTRRRPAPEQRLRMSRKKKAGRQSAPPRWRFFLLRLVRKRRRRDSSASPPECPSGPRPRAVRRLFRPERTEASGSSGCRTGRRAPARRPR